MSWLHRTYYSTFNICLLMKIFVQMSFSSTDSQRRNLICYITAFPTVPSADLRGHLSNVCACSKFSPALMKLTVVCLASTRGRNQVEKLQVNLQYLDFSLYFQTFIPMTQILIPQIIMVITLCVYIYFFFYSASHVPGPSLGASHLFYMIILTIHVGGKHHFHLHFTDEETEAWKDYG